MTTLSRDLTAAPRPTSPGVASQPSADVRPAPRWGHALFMAGLMASIVAGLVVGVMAWQQQSVSMGLTAALLVIGPTVALLFESGAGEMPTDAPVVVRRVCTVCGSEKPASEITYDDVFGFVCHDCDIPPEEAA